MTAARTVLAVIGLVTVIVCLAFAALCVVMARRGRHTRQYQDEMQEVQS